MISKTVKVGADSAVEARTLAMIVQIAGKYESAIRIECGGRSMNAKSIMGVLSLGIKEGESIYVLATGRDEKRAIHALEELVGSGFAEEEE